MTSVLIVGGGVAGLLTAVMLGERGHACELFDARPIGGVESSGGGGGPGCSRHAGGMLAPLCELDVAEPELVRLGLDSAQRWARILGDDARGDLFDVRGSLLVAHRPEWPMLTQLIRRVADAGVQEQAEAVGVDRIAALEPWMAQRLRRGIFVPGEGVVHPERLLPALRARAEAAGVVMHDGVHVDRIAPGCLSIGSQERGADVVVDCRGLGARPDLPLRGVRGEYVIVRSGSVRPARPIRLMHPRYPLYIVPRPDGTLYVGATQVESEHDGPVHVRSALELLSALYSLDPRLADAEIERSGVGLRPALADNLPRLEARAGLLRINGLFRHGFLLAPRLCAWAVDLVEGRALPPAAEPLLRPS